VLEIELHYTCLFLEWLNTQISKLKTKLLAMHYSLIRYLFFFLLTNIRYLFKILYGHILIVEKLMFIVVYVDG
jgi:hypothetical protein